MSREIKFRCWYSGCMIEVGKIEFFDDGEIHVNNELVVKSVMQYTGLKDKNGKEIYEGDIVKCFHDGDAVGNYDIIEYNPGAFCFRYRFTTILQWVDFDGNMEIIGNIYENPELLKGETKS